ncbi:phage tail tape measure protein [Roseovarius sp. D0-M9]|uniref:phage tail tape measure protein n=1 Tax=Roseovarius sp. D0-M9 TaxID=3127117 RepID=UPI00300FC2DC
MANQRLNATVQIGSVLERSVKKNIGIIRSGLEGVGDEIKTITGRQKELSKQRKVLEKQGRSVADLDREYEQLGRQLDTLKRKQERWTRAAQASQRVGHDFRRMTGNISRVARNASVAVGLVGTAIFGLASSTAKLGDDVAKQARKLGIGVEAFQELRYAAERSGIEVSTFDSSMAAFVKRLGEAKGGTGPAADALAELGLNVGDLLKMKPEDALAEVAGKMKDVKNPAERAAIASDLFSRAGLGMINMLMGGKEGLEELFQAARDTGYMLSEETTKAAETFQDRLLDAQLTVKGLKNVIGSEFMPVVQRSMETFTAWAKTNREDIKSFAEQAVLSLERVIPIVGSVASGMGEVAGTVGRVAAKVADMVGGWDNLGVILGAVLTSKAIASIGSFAWSVGRLGWAMWSLVPAMPLVAGGVKAIGAALVANPIGLAVAAIAGGAYLIYKNWEDVGPWFKERLGNVGDVFTGLSDLVGGVFTGDMGRAVDGLKTAWGGVVGWYTGLFEAMGDGARWTYNNVIKPVTDAMGVTENIEAGWRSLKETLGGILEWIGAKFDWVLEKIKPVVDALRWVGSKAGDAMGALGIGGPSGPAPGSADNPYPPGHPMHKPQARATGGSFRAGPLLVGEGGRELRFENRSGFIANNRATERIAALASSARSNVAAAVAGMSGGGSGPVTNHIQINAAGMSASAILDELERRLANANAGALYDGARGYGQYGGVS